VPQLTISMDDTDSDKGLCTTYLAAVLIERIRPLAELVGLPRLVRLNPCARFKTRGNAAVAILLNTSRPDDVREIALQTLLELSDLSGENTNPGLVAAKRATPAMHDFYRRALTEIVEIQDAVDLLEEEGIWYRGLKKGRGLIGALAAAGAVFPDHTYELVTYRRRDRWGSRRAMKEESVWAADAATYPHTWDSVDYAQRRIVFSPHSPDPVLFGIRGDDPGYIWKALRMIWSEEPERAVLYLTNQGTDSHLLPGPSTEIGEDQSFYLEVTVAGLPWEIEGGHVFVQMVYDGRPLSCAAFEPTKRFRDVVRALRPGDRVAVCGAVRGKTLNMEKLDVLDVASVTVKEAPCCPVCLRRMKSAGRGQGYRCRRCGTRAAALTRQIARALQPGLYEVPPSARRHLAKPLIRLDDPRAHPSR